jgi:uncharacterized membrane protein YcaP (DUF421 family)
MELSFAGLPEIILRSSIVYLVIILAFRLAGKRHISQLSVIDFALILLVSNAVQNAMVGTDTSVLGGITAAATLILINVVLTRIVFKDQSLAKFLSGEPRLLVRNGQSVMTNLMKESITEQELEEQIREHGIEKLSDVRTAILEVDGSISVIPYDHEGRHIEKHLPFVRKKKPTRRGAQL